MLLNPKNNLAKEKPVQGSIEAMDPFDHPVPGQSLTDEPGKWAFEKPPQIVEIDDAIAFVVKKTEGNPSVKQEFIKQMLSGMPIESIVNTISLAGFSEGMWSPDIAEIIKLPLASYFMGVAEDANIEATLFNATKEEGMTDETLLGNMKQSNPEAFSALVNSLQAPDGEEIQQGIAQEGFLNVSPDQGMMEEEGII
jgi:hypothetical protein|tara:strand:- start:1331 stop:1918 length:588 start_codon:yes stop_codon:yes gene_type:complete